MGFGFFSPIGPSKRNLFPSIQAKFKNKLITSRSWKSWGLILESKKMLSTYKVQVQGLGCLNAKIGTVIWYVTYRTQEYRVIKKSR